MCDTCVAFQKNVEWLRFFRVLVRLRAKEQGEEHKLETAGQVQFAESELKKAEDAYRRSQQRRRGVERYSRDRCTAHPSLPSNSSSFAHRF